MKLYSENQILRVSKILDSIMSKKSIYVDTLGGRFWKFLPVNHIGEITVSDIEMDGDKIVYLYLDIWFEYLKVRGMHEVSDYMLSKQEG